MKVIARPVSQGKTGEAIRLAAEGFLTIVCANRRRVQDVAAYAGRMGLDIPFPLTFKEFKKDQFCHKSIKGFVIDDADQLLMILCKGVSLDAITVTADQQ